MEKPVIEVKNLGKKYDINHQRGGYIALRDVITNVFKSPFAFIKNRAKEIAGIQTKEEFWALKDVNFTVNKGEMLGIIGLNGAGKSTLLKILSQITPPATGEVKIYGRVGSLLEVGTGFHPELTGRENIFLNGAILGMTRREMAQKFDAIVEFSGVEKFLDTPVKYYSSGMYVRLAFSVAAHMEPDILIVDEVLAVGDAEFQKKCLGKMEQVTKNEGRTVLFVSHNLITVQKLCTRTILLEGGKIKAMGNTKEVVEQYLHNKSDSANVSATSIELNTKRNVGEIRFTDIKVSNIKGSAVIKSDDTLRIAMKYGSNFNEPLTDIRIVITVDSAHSQQTVLRLDSDVTAKTWGETLKPEGEIICETDVLNLTRGKYIVHIDFLRQGTSQDYIKNAAEFNVETDIQNYDYKINPDETVCDYVIRYRFNQK
ncbi:ATP-binding cassette domain-containing protein [Candidatus Parcubacteria bacterium]|nr:ATP-binding cassette domain-containing protein [Candidatus Parcubacteria bacterium]